MTVGELLEALKGLPLETEVFAEDTDTWERENPVRGTEWREIERKGNVKSILCILTDTK